MKTLNEQYRLIKEDKGHKGMFLTEAKRQFPNYIRNAATFDEAEKVLKQKGVITENFTGLEPINSPFSSKETQPFESAFNKFLEETKSPEIKAKEVKAKTLESQEDEEKAELKTPSKQVKDDLEHGYDNKDDKNIDNLIFDQVMTGYYAEMKDPKNADKTMEQLKDIVLKNLAKDPIFYTKDGQFGIKGLGYTTEAPGLGTPKEAKGQYKSSGYGDLKENKDMNIQETKLRRVISTIIREELAKKPLNENVDKRLKEIEAEAAMEAMGSKMEKIMAEIEKRQMQLGKLDEDEDLKAMMDKKATSKIQKEIKLLEKAKAKVEKIMGKGKGKKVEVIDEMNDDIEEGAEEANVEFAESNPEFEKAVARAEEMYNGGLDIKDILVKFNPRMRNDLERHLRTISSDLD